MQLAQSEEFIDETCTGSLGEILIRCNNVMYIKPSEGEETETTGSSMSGFVPIWEKNQLIPIP